MYMKEPKDAESLCALMKKCSELTESERTAIACNDKKQRDKFSWNRCAKETLGFLTE